jgi:hypothetical protein
MNLTDKDLQKWYLENVKNFEVFAPKFLKIKDKNGNIIPLEFNKAQRIFLEKIREYDGKPLRFIILKARQLGLSTITEALIFWRTTYNMYRKSAIVGHKIDATNNLYQMTKRYYKYLPEQLKPAIESSNEKVLRYLETESEIKLYTAESGDIGSSDTIQDLHLTEVAKWRDPKTSLTALLQTVPDKPNTMIVMESTANGIGGEFYDRWQMATAGESNYVPIFISWLIDDEYTLDFIDEEEEYKLKRSLDDIEYGLIEAGATLRHLNWRRKIGLPDKCGNDVDRFRQEYPSNSVEAFIASGSPVFDQKKCYIYFNEASKFKPIIGNLELKNDGEVVFVENERGYLRIFDKDLLKENEISDREFYRFANGADVAEGLAQGDYSACATYDRKKEQVCMLWRGHIDADLFGEELYKLFLFQKKKGFFAIERNNHGLTTIKSAYRRGVKLYYNQSFEKGYPSDTGKIGFLTNSKSKVEIINDLNEWIRDGILESKDKIFWSEALRFVRNEKGQMQAQGKDLDLGVKSFDDTVIAYALMIRCSLWMPNYREEPVRQIQARPYIEELQYEIDEATF